MRSYFVLLAAAFVTLS
jgi:uncharacterized protein (TIGR02246 family)